MREEQGGGREHPDLPQRHEETGHHVQEEQPFVFGSFSDANCAIKVTGRRLVSGVGVMLGDAAVCAVSHTQHCLTFSTTEAEYVAMAEGVKEGLFFRSPLSFMQSGIAFPVELFESNEGGIAVAKNP